MFAYLVCCWLVLLLLPSVAVGQTAKPNVVILFADDVSSYKLNLHINIIIGSPTYLYSWAMET